MRLKMAHGLMARGEYSQAADIFEDLAARAEARGIPRAAGLFLQAGRARMEASEAERGFRHLQHGLSLMVDMGHLRQIPAVALGVLSQLRARGLGPQADALEAEIQTALAHQGLSLAVVPNGPALRLPANCPHCGGIVHPGEAEWIDDRSAVCDYCGSVLEAKGAE